MCNFWSCILTRDNRVIWNKDSNSHEDQIKKTGFVDDKLVDRDFVRIEVVPRKPELIFSKKRADWELKVDEPKTLPKWFTSTRPNLENRVWSEWRAAMKSTLWKLDLAAAKKVVADVKRIKYFSMKGAVKKSWHISLGVNWDAARAAAGDAAWAAAWDAAWDAAGAAVWEVQGAILLEMLRAANKDEGRE